MRRAGAAPRERRGNIVRQMFSLHALLAHGTAASRQAGYDVSSDLQNGQNDTVM